MNMHEHEGHRDRLRAKAETDALLAHERLEVFLFNLLPRQNTNEVAHRLIARFGSLPEVFSATVSELMQVNGIGERAAIGIRNAGIMFAEFVFPYQRAESFIGSFNSKDFLPYVKEKYLGVDYEVLDLYLLNGKGKICKTYRFTNDKGGLVEITPAELSEVLLKEKPSGIVLVHNHPQGEAHSSIADTESTKRCQLVCNMHGVLLCDHIIYAKDGIYSYYLSEELQQISRSFSVNNITGE